MKSVPPPSRGDQIERAIALARTLQERAAELQTSAERRQQAELDRMLQDPRDKVTLLQMTDQAFRAKSRWRVADQMTHILDVQGIPRFFSPWDRTLLRGFQTFGDWLPGVSVPLVKEHMRRESANVVLPAETEHLSEHLRARNAAGLRMNVNFLGEALLGEADANHRLKHYLEALQMPEIEVLSVKISTIYSQISPIAREHTIQVLADRLELLYREAAHLRFTRPDGTTVPKFVYLDMEEYRDMSLTAEVFMRTLDRRGLEDVSAGIALQAYIPDSALTQRSINEWARARVAAGGAPVTIRIVKGANLEMERVEASVRGWPQAPYKTKRETDANYKRMLHEAFRPENLGAVHVGVASHNLFDLAYALVLAADSAAGDAVQFEMLEGMANHQRRALLEETRRLLLYAPACKREDFTNAIGYLIRRLDENTGPENFLRHAFRLKVGSPDWEDLERGFRESFAETPTDQPRRTQNRATGEVERPNLTGGVFINEPDTDFSLPHNGDWAAGIVQRWEPRFDDRATQIALVIAGKEIHERGPVERCIDPSRPGVCVGRYPAAEEGDLRAALDCAQRDPAGWCRRSPRERTEVLLRVAAELRRARADLIGAAMANTGKTIAEADPEVSEAIDFAEYYAHSAEEWFSRTAGARGKGVAVVVPPWNFPIAIPCGGILAALAAGNTVILKPATPAVLVAWELCQCFWRAGVSKETLQFIPCSGIELASKLVSASEVDAVILTGGTATALSMLR
ncbi:MAG: proline dehydrogenase family protein, partial [Chthoniobacteraceae bacterium]